mgnify:CR=1 FL=1
MPNNNEINASNPAGPVTVSAVAESELERSLAFSCNATNSVPTTVYIHEDIAARLATKLSGLHVSVGEYLKAIVEILDPIDWATVADADSLVAINSSIDALAATDAGVRQLVAQVEQYAKHQWSVDVDGAPSKLYAIARKANNTPGRERLGVPLTDAQVASNADLIDDYLRDWVMICIRGKLHFDESYIRLYAKGGIYELDEDDIHDLRNLMARTGRKGIKGEWLALAASLVIAYDTSAEAESAEVEASSGADTAKIGGTST